MNSNTDKTKILGYDANKMPIYIGSVVLMPEPEASKGDSWIFGNFSTYVKNVRQDRNEIFLIVIDSDGDCFCVEPNRVQVDIS